MFNRNVEKRFYIIYVYIFMCMYGCTYVCIVIDTDMYEYLNCKFHFLNGRRAQTFLPYMTVAHGMKTLKCSWRRRLFSHTLFFFFFFFMRSILIWKTHWSLTAVCRHVYFHAQFKMFYNKETNREKKHSEK